MTRRASVSYTHLSKTVKGGRIMKFAALVVVGDGGALQGNLVHVLLSSSFALADCLRHFAGLADVYKRQTGAFALEP